MNVIQSAPAAEIDGICARFLFEEAATLDRRDYRGWLDMLTPDVKYEIPLRSVHLDGRNEYSTRSFYMNETYDSLEARIARFATDYAWAEEPPSKTRHCVSNVMAEEKCGDEVHVRSNIVLLRYTAGAAQPAIVSAERSDVLRRTPNGLRLRWRYAYVDSSVLGTHNFTVFL